MIGYLGVVPLLVAACPDYADSPHAADADEGDGEYLRIGQVVKHLIHLLGRGRTADFTAVFAVVDWVLGEGDEEARSLVTNGFIDDLTNPGLYLDTPCRPADFVPWLGPLARELPAVRQLT